MFCLATKLLMAGQLRQTHRQKGTLTQPVKYVALQRMLFHYAHVQGSSFRNVNKTNMTSRRNISFLPSQIIKYGPEVESLFVNVVTAKSS